MLFVKMLPGGSLEVPLLLHSSWWHWRHAELPDALLHAAVALDAKERPHVAHLLPLPPLSPFLPTNSGSRHRSSSRASALPTRLSSSFPSSQVLPARIEDHGEVCCTSLSLLVQGIGPGAPESTPASPLPPHRPGCCRARGRRFPPLRTVADQPRAIRVSRAPSCLLPPPPLSCAAVHRRPPPCLPPVTPA